MYFKAPDNSSRINIPIGYRGNAFSPAARESRSSFTPNKAPPGDYEKRDSLPCKNIIGSSLPADSKPSQRAGDSSEDAYTEVKEVAKGGSVLAKILSPEGSFEAEELLLLALALIIFQGGKENELALLLLALLFIK